MGRMARHKVTSDKNLVILEPGWLRYMYTSCWITQRKIISDEGVARDLCQPAITIWHKIKSHGYWNIVVQSAHNQQKLKFMISDCTKYELGACNVAYRVVMLRNLQAHKHIYSQVPLYRGPIFHDITYGTAKTVAECELDFRITTDTPYLALTGELWSVFCEDSGENWPRYDGTALYIDGERRNGRQQYPSILRCQW